MLPCYARLGETVEQSIQRYGQPTSNGDQAQDCKILIFKRAPFEIIANFYQDKCVALTFYKRQANSDGTLGEENQPLSDEEIKGLMEQNSDGKTWGQPTTSEASDCVIWVRPDGVVVTYDKNNYWLMFRRNDSAFSAYSTAIKEADKKQKRDEVKKETNGL